MREKILSYTNVHAGEPVCIIANGSSAAKIDWAKCPTLKMGLNRAWQLTDCDYYVMGDMGQFATFVRERGDLKQLSPLFTLDDGPEHAIRIPELRSARMRLRRGSVFSFDLAVGVYPGKTVTAFGIQLAVWMGCNPIYIAGLDCEGKHFWGGSEMRESDAANQRETFAYIAGLLEGMGSPAPPIHTPSAATMAPYRVVRHQWMPSLASPRAVLVRAWPRRRQAELPLDVAPHHLYRVGEPFALELPVDGSHAPAPLDVDSYLVVEWSTG